MNGKCGGPRVGFVLYGLPFTAYRFAVQNKIFWALVLVLSLLADMVLPLIWGLVATIPIVIISWWVVYRSGWF